MAPLPEPHDNDPAAAVQTPAPGLIAGICSIVAGIIGFAIPILGVIASIVGIWLGSNAILRGRAAHYSSSIMCGGIGITVSIVGIVYWVCAILFESYR